VDIALHDWGKPRPTARLAINEEIADALTARLGYQSAYFDDPRAQ